MKVIVDTCVWSLALRRKTEPLNANVAIAELKSLILDFRVQIIGSIRQEILSGIKNESQFEKFRAPDTTNLIYCFN